MTRRTMGWWMRKAKQTALKCIHCGNPASCVGKYDNMDGYEPACDDCCGHGNEDGHCEQVTADPA